MNKVSITLRQVTQLALDMFNQNYKTDEDIFDKVHFRMLLIGQYVGMLNAEFKENKVRNKVTDGFSWVEISPSWLQEGEFELKEDPLTKHRYAEIPDGVQSFTYDILGSGVQTVDPIGSCTLRPKRIAYRDVKDLRHMPITQYLYWYVKSNTRIVFPKAPGEVEKVIINYVPLVNMDDECVLIGDLDEKMIPLITNVLNLMFGAKKGEIVDMSNDSNPNKVMEKEVDKDLLK